MFEQLSSAFVFMKIHKLLNNLQFVLFPAKFCYENDDSQNPSSQIFAL